MIQSMNEKIKNILYGFALVGARIYWRVFRPKTYGARVILMCGEKILLVQPRRSQYWNFPGGGVKKNEQSEQGALRELYEETGIRIQNKDYILGTYLAQAEGKRDTVTIIVARAETELIPKLEIEIQNAQWFLVKELPETTTKSTLRRINEYLQGMKNIEGSW